MYNTFDFSTEVLSASIRHPKHFVEVALAGSDVATIPYNVYKKLINHPLTDKGNQKSFKIGRACPTTISRGCRELDEEAISMIG